MPRPNTGVFRVAIGSVRLIAASVFLQGDVDGVYHSWEVAEQSEQDIDPEVKLYADLQEDTKRGRRIDSMILRMSMPPFLPEGSQLGRLTCNYPEKLGEEAAAKAANRGKAGCGCRHAASEG